MNSLTISFISNLSSFSPSSISKSYSYSYFRFVRSVRKADLLSSKLTSFVFVNVLWRCRFAIKRIIQLNEFIFLLRTSLYSNWNDLFIAVWNSFQNLKVLSGRGYSRSNISTVNLRSIIHPHTSIGSNKSWLWINYLVQIRD